MAKGIASPKSTWPGGSLSLREPKLSSTIKVRSKKAKGVKIPGFKPIKNTVPLGNLMRGLSYN